MTRSLVLVGRNVGAGYKQDLALLRMFLRSRAT